MGQGFAAYLRVSVPRSRLALGMRICLRCDGSYLSGLDQHDWRVASEAECASWH